jgi:flagellar motor switch protein FliM
VSRLLTQEEVDALLLSGETPPSAPDVAPSAPQPAFDLRAPLALVGSRLAAVEATAEHVASAIGRALRGVVGVEPAIQWTPAGFVQQPAATLLEGQSADAAVGLIATAEGSVVGGILMPAELVVLLAETMQGASPQRVAAARSLSDTELCLLEAAHARMVAAISRATRLGPLESAGIETHPAEGLLARRGGALCAVRVRMRLEGGDLMVSLLMTRALADRLVDTVPNDDAPRDASPALRDALSGVAVRLQPVIGNSRISLADLQRLDVGQVLLLDAGPDGELGLSFNGATLGTARRDDAGGRTRLVVTRLRPASGHEGKR